MAVQHLEDISLSSEKRTVTISIYFNTTRKVYLLYWNGAYWTQKFSLLSTASEINQFMKRKELPEYPGMEEKQ